MVPAGHCHYRHPSNPINRGQQRKAMSVTIMLITSRSFSPFIIQDSRYVIDACSSVMVCSRAAILAGGDAAAVLIFATVGRGSHAELDGIAGVLVTAWPFLAGLYLCLAATKRKILCALLFSHRLDCLRTSCPPRPLLWQVGRCMHVLLMLRLVLGRAVRGCQG